MQYHFAGDSPSFYVPFIVNDEYVVPEIGSVTYTIRDTQGVVLVGYSDVAVTTDENSTSVNIVVPAAANAKTNTVEMRSMTVKFTYGGNSYRKAVQWGIIDWVNLFVEPDDVRRLIGANIFELTDADVDLVGAYMVTKSEVSDLDDYLVSGENSQLLANRLVTLKAALILMPSLQLRLNKREKSDAVEFERLSKIDLGRLNAELAAEYSGLVGQLTGVTETTPTLFTVSNPTDPVTGA